MNATIHSLDTELEIGKKSVDCQWEVLMTVAARPRPIFSSSQSLPTSAFMCDVEEGEVAINVLVTQCGRVIIHYIIIIVSVGELPLRGAVSFHFLEVEILFTFDTPALCLGEITGMGPLGSQK